MAWHRGHVEMERRALACFVALSPRAVCFSPLEVGALVGGVALGITAAIANDPCQGWLCFSDEEALPGLARA